MSAEVHDEVAPRASVQQRDDASDAVPVIDLECAGSEGCDYDCAGCGVSLPSTEELRTMLKYTLFRSRVTRDDLSKDFDRLRVAGSQAIDDKVFQAIDELDSANENLAQALDLVVEML